MGPGPWHKDEEVLSLHFRNSNEEEGPKVKCQWSVISEVVESDIGHCGSRQVFIRKVTLGQVSFWKRKGFSFREIMMVKAGKEGKGTNCPLMVLVVFWQDKVQ